MEDREKEKQKKVKAYQAGDIDWYEDEFLDLNLGDKRLDMRLGIIMKYRMQSPNSSIPDSFVSWAKTKGAYRFFSNDKADPELIMNSHKNSTIKRLKDNKIILAPQDSTDIAYSNHKETQGLGYVNDSESAIGYHYHPTLAVTVEGTPLGILDSQVWVRETLNKGKTKKEKYNEKKYTPIEQKESNKWLKSYQKLCEIEKNNHQDFHLVSVCDREADIFELFNEHAKITNEYKPDLLVRAKSDRVISEGTEKKLFDELNNHEEFAEYEIIVPRKKNTPPRETTLRVKFKEVNIEPPTSLLNRSTYSKIKLYAVTTNEVNTPKGVEPVHWFILTTIPVLNYEDAFEKIEWYRQRWVIEVFFKTLKSGCNIEDYQLHTFERLKRVLAIDSIIAWRILFLTTIGREYPDLPASVIFEEHEWKALYAIIHMTKDVPNEVPKLSVVMRQIGQLGGHLGRKSDGYPGILTISKGLYKLYSISIVWKLLTYG